VITREDLVSQAVQDFARAGLQRHGYVEPAVRFLDSFPYTIAKLDAQLIASGFDFDDEGTQAELGSDLKRRLYTVQFFVFGTTGTWAKNLANVLKFVLDEDGTIPLHDYEDPAKPEVDRLVVIGVSAERQIVVDPEPWQEHIWSTTCRVEDTYNARLVA
jgi:hypothetical protein